MPIVKKAGAETFRQPLPPTVNNDGVVRKAAEYGIPIHAEVSASYPNDPGLPSGANRTDFLQKLRAEVELYGYNGKFWDRPENSNLPKKHITTWEVWNEPNLAGINPIEYGQFLNEAADTIQSASQAMAGRNTEVLSAGLLAWGNVGTGPVGYYGALSYLQEAYSQFGGNAKVTGVAIHPYELDASTFLDPDGSGPKPRYSRVEAFKYAVAGFHTKLVELAKGGSQKSLWITETGWPVEGSPEYPVTEADQADALRQVVDYLRNNEASLNVKDLLWYNFRDAPGSSSWDNFCGLRAADGHFRQAWTAFQEKAGVPSSIPQAPGIEARPATNLEETKAKLNGWVHPQGLPTTYYFDYGTTTAFGNSTAPASAGSGPIGVWVDATPTNLQPDTRYYYRVVAANAVGVSISGISTFKTPKETVAFSSYGARELWTWSRPGFVNTKLGVAPETSPSIAALDIGGTKVAFSSYGPNKLFTYGPGNTFQEYPYWLEPKSSPSITALAGGGWAIAFVGLGNHHLWVMTNSGVVDTGLGVEVESSPSITALPGGSYVVAFAAYGSRELWTYSPSTGGTPRSYFITPYSSPDIAAVGSSYVVAFNGLGSGTLWTWAPGYGGYNHALGLAVYTSPSIATTLNGFTVGYSASGTSNFTVMRSEGGNASVTNSGLSINSYSSPDLASIYGVNYTSAFTASGTNMLWTLTPFVGAFNQNVGVAPNTTPSIAYG